MKIAVIGDIHSNHTALETCIRHALDRNVDEFLFLGDYISDCPYPQKAMQVIYEMQKKYICHFIRGNWEDYMLNHRKNPKERWTFSSASGNLLYTYENLCEEDFQFYKGLDIQGIYRKEGYPASVYLSILGFPLSHARVYCIRSFVPISKKSTIGARLSLISAAAGVSIIIPVSTFSE